jgi:hypothetical protein
MIVSIPLDINDLLLLLKKFPWPRPEHCPRCSSPGLWGHGFVDSWFDAISSALPLKRYRCRNCKCVVKLKPAGYFKRFQASIDTIRASISPTVGTDPLNTISRQRRHHWLTALKKKTLAILGLGTDLKQAFENLIDMGIVPVSRAV